MLVPSIIPLLEKETIASKAEATEVRDTAFYGIVSIWAFMKTL